MHKQLLSVRQNWQITEPYEFSEEDSIFLTLHPINDDNEWKDSSYKPIKDKIRDYYFDIQNGTCAYCRLPINGGTDNIEIEHIVDKNHRPDFTFEALNLVVSCHNCNFNKSTNKVLYVCPSENEYPNLKEHFKITHGHFDNYFLNIEFRHGSIYHALNEKGEFTIDKCKLDRIKLAEQREAVQMFQDDEIILRVIELRNLGNHEEELNEILNKLNEIKNR